MNKKSFLLILVSSSLLLASLVSCKASSGEVYAETFVNALVKAKGLTPQDGKFIFKENIIEKATEYTFTLTCDEDNAYGYVFNSNLTKKVKSGTIEGYIYSDVSFLWSRFQSSLFVGSADLISNSVETTPMYLFYGLVFNDDGTLKNSTYYQTYKSIDSAFNSIDVVDDSWVMTTTQVKHLNEIAQECCGIYLW